MGAFDAVGDTVPPTGAIDAYGDRIPAPDGVERPHRASFVPDRANRAHRRHGHQEAGIGAVSLSVVGGYWMP